MRLLVAIENRFLQTPDGTVYSTTNCDYAFWSRYLTAFDHVVVFARIAQIPEMTVTRLPANGPHVSFCPLPSYIGPWQFLRNYATIRSCTRRAISSADAFILRVPGTLSNLVWKELCKRGIPYGVEIVADPWEAMRAGNIKSILRPFLRRMARMSLVRQCKSASTASYVTAQTLQKLYPATCWQTHYSSIDLPETMIIDDNGITNRINKIKKDGFCNGRLLICNLAGMTGFYKGQDILIEAVSLCRKKGLQIDLVLMGDGRCKEYYMDKVRQCGLSEHVTFAGNVVRGEDLITELDSADLFVFPSFTEGLPRGVIDAMARGLPCITSNVGGIPELLPLEDMVPPRDPIALADKIESIVKNPERMMKTVRRNVETARTYCSGELGGRRIEHYRKLKEITAAYWSSRK